MDDHESHVLLIVAIVAVVAMALLVMSALAPGRNVGASFWLEPHISQGPLQSGQKCCLGGYEVYDCDSSIKKQRCSAAGGSCVDEASSDC